MVKIIDNETGLYQEVTFSFTVALFFLRYDYGFFPIQAFGKYDKDGFGGIRADIGAKSRFL
jgi:hypothetical protein